MIVIVFVVLTQLSSVATSSHSLCSSELDSVERSQYGYAVGLGRAQLAPWSGIRVKSSDSGESASSEVDLRIRTVGLGSSLKKVRKRLGAPTKQQREFISDNTCFPAATSLELSYHGMTVRLLGSRDGKQFSVVSIEVEAPRWLIQPSLRVGMDERLIRKRLGVPAGESNENGFHRLHYVNKGKNGFAVFYFRDSMLAKVKWESALC